jgi:hypothetical protein
MDRAARELAEAVTSQWKRESRNLRINEVNTPAPLDVRLRPADEDLFWDWSQLQELAVGGLGWFGPTWAGIAGWAGGPAGLAGSATDIARIVRQVPTGRLVILGEPGAGKSTLLIRLVLDLLDDRPAGEPEEPVPLLVPIHRWDPTSQDLVGFLEQRLEVDYAHLVRPAPGRPDRTVLRAMLEEGMILPVLDGLDEVADGLRDLALEKINQGLRPRQPMVLTSRDAAYREAVRPAGGCGTCREPQVCGCAPSTGPPPPAICAQRPAGRRPAGHRSWRR